MLHVSTEGVVRETVSNCLVPARACTMMLPSQIGDFTDFYTSIHHARRAGELVRPDAPVHPNFRSIPIAYHGRSSSVTLSGEPCRRPRGQTSAASGYQPTAKLDFELEVGFYVGENTDSMKRLSVDSAEDHLFGFCLVNDWSARDIQRWESAPLGPFLAKSFMTGASPWVVTAEAIAPFRVVATPRGDDAPLLAAELASASHDASAAIDISLRVTLQSRSMKEAGIAGVDVANPNFKDQYWSVSQMLTHHASNGCPLRSGDLISSGTVSGPERNDSGCLLERTRDGRETITLPTGEVRGYLEDGDTVSFSGRCARDGFRTIGFGECVAEVIGDL
jgi:fumarylacetoacetase